MHLVGSGLAGTSVASTERLVVHGDPVGQRERLDRNRSRVAEVVDAVDDLTVLRTPRTGRTEGREVARDHDEAGTADSIGAGVRSAACLVDLGHVAQVLLRESFAPVLGAEDLPPRSGADREGEPLRRTRIGAG